MEEFNVQSNSPEAGKKRFTYENPCPLCGFPVDVRDHDPEICQNAREEAGKGEKEDWNEGLPKTNHEYIERLMERYRSMSSMTPEEIKKEEKQKNKPGDLDQEVGKLFSSLFKENTAETLPAHMKERQRAIEVAIETANDSFRREIDFGLSAGSKLRLMDKTDGEVEKFIEKSFCRSMEAAVAGLESLSKDDLMKIASRVVVEKAPERIKEIFFRVLNNYIDKI